MHKQRRPLLFLFFSILSLLALSLIIYFLPPDKMFQLGTISLSILPLFFVLLFTFFLTTGTYIFNSKLHGCLIALFVLCFSLFRINNLTHPFFLVLLVALFFVLELLFTTRK